MQLIKLYETLKKRNFKSQTSIYSYDPARSSMNLEVIAKTQVTSFEPLCVEKDYGDYLLQVWVYPNSYCLTNVAHLIKEGNTIVKVLQYPVFIGELEDPSELLSVINQYEENYSQAIKRPKVS